MVAWPFEEGSRDRNLKSLLCGRVRRFINHGRLESKIHQFDRLTIVETMFKESLIMFVREINRAIYKIRRFSFYRFI